MVDRTFTPREGNPSTSSSVHIFGIFPSYQFIWLNTSVMQNSFGSIDFTHLLDFYECLTYPCSGFIQYFSINCFQLFSSCDIPYKFSFYFWLCSHRIRQANQSEENIVEISQNSQFLGTRMQNLRLRKVSYVLQKKIKQSKKLSNLSVLTIVKEMKQQHKI